MRTITRIYKTGKPRMSTVQLDCGHKTEHDTASIKRWQWFIGRTGMNCPKCHADPSKPMRTWTLAYEIDIDAETAEDAAQQALQFARDESCIATWCVRSSESNQGEQLPEITGLVHIHPDGHAEAELNEPEEHEHKSCTVCGECVHCGLRPCRDGGPHTLEAK